MVLKLEDIAIPVEPIVDEENEKRAHNALFYSEQFGIPADTAFDLEPELNIEVFGKEVLPFQPRKLFFDAFKQSLADKPAMILKGTTVYTPGKALGIDPLLDKTSTYIQSLKDPEITKKVQTATQSKLWPIGDERRWWQLEAKYLPEVINAWAANVGDQIPIMLTTLAGRLAGKALGEAIGAVAGLGTAAATAGPDPTDVATAPAAMAITKEVIKHLGGAAPLVAMEAGAFLDDAADLEIDADIAEKYARLYGLGSGAIEYAQWLWVLGRYSKIAKPAQETITRTVLGHIGGSAFEGLEEISQGGLERFLLQKAVAEMKKRHPEYKKEAPKITKGWKREGAIGSGVAFLTGLPGTGMSIGKGQIARRIQVKPETKKFLNEPSVQETRQKEKPVEAAPPPEAAPAETAPAIEVEERTALENELTRELAERMGVPEHIARQEVRRAMAEAEKRTTEAVPAVETAPAEVVPAIEAEQRTKLEDELKDLQKEREKTLKLIAESEELGAPPALVEPTKRALAEVERRINEIEQQLQAAEAARPKVKPTHVEAEEFETPAEAEEAEARLETEAGEMVKPKLYIGNVTEGMKKRIEEKIGFPAEDVKGFVERGFPTKRTEIPITRGEAEKALESLENDLIDDLNNNRINTENDLALANANWGNIKELRKVLGLEEVQCPFKVIRAKGHLVKVIKNTKSRIYEAIRPTDESKMTVGEVLSAVMKRGARFAKMAYITGRRELRAEMRAKARARKRLNAAIKKIKQNVPKSVDFFYREAIEALRSNIDLKRRSERSIANRKSTLEFLRRVPEEEKANIPEKVIDMATRKPLNDFTIEELEKIAGEVDKLIKQGKLKRRLLLKPQIEQRKQDIQNLTEIVSGQLENKTKEGVTVTKEGKIKTAFNKFMLWTWTPSRLFDMLDGGKAKFSGLWHRIFYDDTKTRKDTVTKSVRDTEKQFVEKREELKISLWDLAKTRIIQADGAEIRLSMQEIIGIYINSLNPLNKLHLIYGKYHLHGQIIEFTEKGIQDVIDSMTAQEKELADWILNWYKENYSDLRRAVIEQENRDMGEEEFYSPILPKDISWKNLADEIRMAVDQRLQLRAHNVAHGFTLERKNVPEWLRGEIRLDAVNVFVGQVQKQARYIHLGPHIRRLNKIRGNKALRKVIADKFGDEILKMLDGYVGSVANPYIYRQYSLPERISAKLRQNTAIAYLAFNLTTMAKQPFAILFYLPDAGPSHLIASIMDFATNPLEMIKKVRDLDPEVAQLSMEREFEELKSGENANIIKKAVTDAGLEGIYYFDQVARVIGWNAVYERSLSEGDSHVEAVRKAQDATLRTQNAAEAEDIPALYRTSEFLNWFLLFTNQINKMWNMATYDIPSYFKNQDYAKSALGISALAINGMIMWMIANRKWPEKPEDLAEAIAEQSLELIPLLGKPILDGIEGWETDVPIFSPAKAIGKGIKPIERGITTGKWELSRYDIEKIAEGFSVGAGLPYTGIKRIEQAIEYKQPTAVFGARKPRKKKIKAHF